MGAWWIGFIVAAALSAVVSIVLCGFPKYLPGRKEVLKMKVMLCSQYCAVTLNVNQNIHYYSSMSVFVAGKIVPGCSNGLWP